MRDVLRMNGVLRIVSVGPLLKSRAPGADSPTGGSYFPHQHVLTWLRHPHCCGSDGARSRTAHMAVTEIVALAASAAEAWSGGNGVPAGRIVRGAYHCQSHQ